MTAIAHTLMSLPFGLYLESPVIIFLTALVFHLFADTLLHWNIFPFQFKRYFHLLALIDVTTAFGLSWLILGSDIWSIAVWAAIIGGNIADAGSVLWETAKPRLQDKLAWARPAFHVHTMLQLETVSLSRGLIWQAVLVAISLASVWFYYNN